MSFWYLGLDAGQCRLNVHRMRSSHRLRKQDWFAATFRTINSSTSCYVTFDKLRRILLINDPPANFFLKKWSDSCQKWVVGQTFMHPKYFFSTHYTAFCLVLVTFTISRTVASHRGRDFAHHVGLADPWCWAHGSSQRSFRIKVLGLNNLFNVHLTFSGPDIACCSCTGRT